MHDIPRLVRKAVRRTWMKHAMRGVGGADNYEKLDLAYSLSDPWDLDSPKERARFEATNRLINRQFGRVGSLLELGCGEGHQSEHLSKLTDTLYGLDVSEKAIERARQRVPGGNFAVADLATQPWGDSPRRFDLITACEMLYYVRDVEATIGLMSRLSSACLVTIFSPAARRLGDHLDRIPGATRDWFHCADTVWLAVSWRNA